MMFQDLNVNGQLVALERLLEEFFNPLTNNVRKHEIEQQLESFRSAPEIWKLCLYFVTNTSSQYVTMFALSTLEVCYTYIVNFYLTQLYF